MSDVPRTRPQEVLAVHETPYFHSSTFVEEGGINQKLKVLPLTWFYGGKELADNPFLPRAHEPASP